MENYIIGAVLIIALIIGVIYTVKHSRGEGGCCGGRSYKLKKVRPHANEKAESVDSAFCFCYSLPVQQYVHSLHGSMPIASSMPSKELYSSEVKFNFLRISSTIALYCSVPNMV